MSTVTETFPSAAPSRVLHFGLWTTQVLLALPFLAAGLWKTTAPLDELAAAMTWVANTGPYFVRFIGTAELLGAIGLIVPAATRILPVLTPAAATGLFTIMALAIPMHLLVEGDPSPLPVNVVLGAMAAFVAWGRFAKAPIAAR